jgi:hypothetical protein
MKLTQKKNCNSCLLLHLVVICLFLTAGNATAAFQPEWLQAHLNGTLKMQKLYYGAGFAAYKGERPGYDTLRLAKDRALDELCYQLSVSIRSEFEEKLTHKKKYEDQQIASSLFISTRNVLSGIQEKEKWTDSGKRRHWVLLVIDKTKADQQVEQQKFINEVVDRLEHNQKEISAGIKKMASVLNNNMQVYKARMDQLESLLQNIDSKVAASGEQVKDEYAILRHDIMRLESSRKNYEEHLIESQRRQGEQLDALMAQNKMLLAQMGRLSQRIQGDYFLALADDDVRNKDTSTDFKVSIKPDKGQGADYYAGEKVRFLVKPNRGCYLKVVYFSSKDSQSGGEKKISTVLFPNQHDMDNWIDAGETKVIGRFGELEIQRPFGKDVITVIASKKQFADIKELTTDAYGGYHSEVTSNTRGALDMRARGIHVRPPESGKAHGATSPEQSTPIASDTCFIISHP